MAELTEKQKLRKLHRVANLVSGKLGAKVQNHSNKGFSINADGRDIFTQIYFPDDAEHSKYLTCSCTYYMYNYHKEIEEWHQAGILTQDLVDEVIYDTHADKWIAHAGYGAITCKHDFDLEDSPENIAFDILSFAEKDKTKVIEIFDEIAKKCKELE